MKTTNNVRIAGRITALTALLVFSAIAAAPALAQAPAPLRTDGRWTPYLGCWRLVVENVRNQGIEDLIRSATEAATTPAMTVCVQPSATSTGVTMTSFADGKKVLEQAILWLRTKGINLRKIKAPTKRVTRVMRIRTCLTRARLR